MMIKNANKNKYKTLFSWYGVMKHVIFFVKLYLFYFAACVSEKDCHLVSNRLLHFAIMILIKYMTQFSNENFNF